MPINVALQNIEGKKYKEVVPTMGLLDYLLPIGDARYPMLRYIDPYGNTIFNGTQMHPVLEELDRLEGKEELDRLVAEQISAEDGKKVLAQIRELAIYCRDHPHTYLRFIGD